MLSWRIKTARCSTLQCTAGLDVLTHHVLSHVPEVAHYGTHHVSRDPRGPGPILITITSSSANVPPLLAAHWEQANNRLRLRVHPPHTPHSVWSPIYYQLSLMFWMRKSCSVMSEWYNLETYTDNGRLCKGYEFQSHKPIKNIAFWA